MTVGAANQSPRSAPPSTEKQERQFAELGGRPPGRPPKPGFGDLDRGRDREKQF